MSKVFDTEAQEVFKFYHGQQKGGTNPFFNNGVKSPLPQALQDEMIGFTQHRNGIVEGRMLDGNRLVGEFFFRETFENFDNNGDHFLNYQELILWMVETTAKSITPLKCNHCLMNSRKKLKILFDYMDCDKNGFIDSEDMWNGWSEMKTFELFTTASTNDLLLKSDINGDARLSPQEFIEGVLHGYWERQCGEKGPSNAYEELKKVREENYNMRKKTRKGEKKQSQ